MGLRTEICRIAIHRVTSHRHVVGTGVLGLVLLGSAPALAAGPTDHLDLTAPSAAVAALPDYTTATTLTVRYVGADKGSYASGVRNYDLRYRVAAWRGNFGGYAYPASWQARTATSLAFATTAGSDYCVSVRSRDNNGNVSSWTADTCSTVALDDRSLAARGTWKRTSDAASYRGTLTQSSSYRASLSVAARGKRMALVVTTCAACGKVAIVLDGQLWRTIDTHSKSTARKVILVQPAGAFVVNTTITLGVAQARPVLVDGIAVTSR